MQNWTRWHRPKQRLMPSKLALWLTETGSLTRRLQAHNQHGFSVDLLGNCWIKPLTDEAISLGLPVAEHVYQREVRLMDGDAANVYARTIIPRGTYMAMPHRFNSLGNKPLGELLFTDPQVKRGSIEIACLKPGQWLYEMAVLDENYRPEALWGRRSSFDLSGNKLLVNEIFLPTLWNK